MNSERTNYLFKQFAGAVAYVATERADGSHGIGSAFHVGDGVFVTARHVVEGLRIREIATTEHTYVYLTGEAAAGSQFSVVEDGQSRPAYVVAPRVFELDAGPFFHSLWNDVDVAAFRVRNPDPRMPWVRLGDHLDDWLGTSDFVLSEVIILGYPPIPMTQRPHLVAARAEVNAQVDLRNGRHVHFILSAMPRGGFSGGLAVSEREIALGVITSSLLTNDNQLELGFFSVLSVEPIYNCLASHKLLPKCQAEGWDDFWNIEPEYFSRPDHGPTIGGGLRIEASVGVFDDGHKFYLELSCDGSTDLVALILRRAEEHLSSFGIRHHGVRPGLVQLHIENPTVETRAKLDDARQAACDALIEAGYQPISAALDDSEERRPKAANARQRPPAA